MLWGKSFENFFDTQKKFGKFFMGEKFFKIFFYFFFKKSVLKKIFF